MPLNVSKLPLKIIKFISNLGGVQNIDLTSVSSHICSPKLPFASVECRVSAGPEGRGLTESPHSVSFLSVTGVHQCR